MRACLYAAGFFAVTAITLPDQHFANRGLCILMHAWPWGQQGAGTAKTVYALRRFCVGKAILFGH